MSLKAVACAVGAAVATNVALAANDYSGISIKADNAMVRFSTDASLRRVGSNTLQSDANLRINGTLIVKGDLDVRGDIYLNGTSLSAMLALLRNQVSTVADTPSTMSSCSDIYIAKGGAAADGVYTITVAGEEVDVYCDMKNGGWTRVINVLSSTPQSDYVDVNAVNDGITNSTSMYKLSDRQINEIAVSAGVKDYLYVCGDEVEFVTRRQDEGNWTSLRDQGGWVVDRDMDGRYDCTADRPSYIFADYIVSGWSGEALHAGTDCSTGIHTDFGEDSTQTGCYMSNVGSGWSNAASVWVGGQFAKNRAITICTGDGVDCEYSTHFDSLYDLITR